MVWFPLEEAASLLCMFLFQPRVVTEMVLGRGELVHHGEHVIQEAVLHVTEHSRRGKMERLKINSTTQFLVIPKLATDNPACTKVGRCHRDAPVAVTVHRRGARFA